MNFYERSLELREETVARRRWLRNNAEVYGRGAHSAYPHSSIDPINIGT